MSDDEAPEEFGTTNAVAVPSHAAKGTGSKRKRAAPAGPVLKIAPLPAEVLAALQPQRNSDASADRGDEKNNDENDEDELALQAAKRRKARAKARQKEAALAALEAKAKKKRVVEKEGIHVEVAPPVVTTRVEFTEEASSNTAAAGPSSMETAAAFLRQRLLAGQNRVPAAKATNAKRGRR